MIIAIASFLLSLVALSVLLLHKVIELRRGAPLISETMRNATDAMIVEHVSVVREHVVQHAVETGARFISHGFYLVTRWVRSVFFLAVRALHAKLTELLERVQHPRGIHAGQGHGQGRDAGSVSFFLKHISEGREPRQGRR